jgi:hypothetical protein
MEAEIDLSAARLIRWLRDELGRGAPRVAVHCSREFVSEPTDGPVAAGDEYGDLSATITIGMIELTPAAGQGGWRLTLRLEDPLGAHLPEDGSVPEGPEALSFADFEAAFAAADDLAASVTLESDGPEARRKAERIIAHILGDGASN